MKNLLRDFFHLYRTSIVAVVMLSIAAAGLQILSLIMAFDYINLLLERAARIALMSRWLTNQPDGFLVLVPFGILMCLLTSAALGYRAHIVSVNTMLSHERHCLKELVAKVHQLAHFPAGTYTQADIIRLASKDIRQYGRLIDAFLDACLPSVFFLAAVSVLFYLAPTATLGLLAFIAVFLVLFLRSSRAVAALGIELEESAKPDIAARRNAVEIGLLNNNSSDEQLAADLSQLSEDPDIGRFLDVYGRRLLINFRAVWVSGSFLAALIAAVLLYIGQELVSGNNVIVDVLIYVVGLNFCLVQVRRLSTVVTKVRVFQPFAQRYRNFMHSPPPSSSSEHDSLRIRNARLHSGELVNSHKYHPGDCFGVLYGKPLNKISLGDICYSLGVPASFPLVPYIVRYDIPGNSERLQSLVNEFNSNSRRLLLENGCTELVNLVDHDLKSASDMYPDDEFFQNLHRRVGFILQVLECHHKNSCNVVFLEGKGFRGIRFPVLRDLKTLLQDKVQIVVYDTPPEKPPFEISTFFQCNPVAVESEISEVENEIEAL